MKKTALIAALLFWVSATVSAQSVGKSLAFAQIASGGVWESVINVTNRGTTTYTGSLSLFTMSSDGSSPQPWNPIVNGTYVTGGQMAISLPAGNTRTLTITAPNLQVGFGTITPAAPSTTDDTSFVEGALTYYFLSGGAIVDSIGVEPSSPIYLTTIPFDDFSNITLALANANVAATSVNLRMYSASSQVLGTATLPLAGKAHVAKYLSEIFPSIQGGLAGRLDIECDAPIYGVALTQAGSQFSSLPFQPAVKVYNWTINFQGIIKTGLLSTRLSGSLGDSMSATLTPTQETPRYISGTFTSGAFTKVDYDVSNNQIEYWSLSSYSFSAPTINGTVRIWTINPFTYQGQGTITLTAAN